MPFDGITIHALQEEIGDYLIGSKVDKIHQPENDEIILIIRKDRKNIRLLLSADSNLPHFSISESKKENPVTAPMFCMLLRKHLAGGKLLNIEQLGLERVLILSIESKDDLGNTSVKRLIFEIMGKHSNITLVDDQDKIIDCIKRIALGVNRYRQLFPGITYMYPPNEKVDPRHVSDQTLINQLKVSDLPLFKHIYMVFQGISPIVAKEICIRAGLDSNTIANALTDDGLKAIATAFKLFFCSINDRAYYKNVVYNTNKSLKDFSVVDLSLYHTQAFKIVEFETVNDVVSNYYANKNTVNKLLLRSHNLRKSVQGKIDKSTKKLKNLNKDLKTADNADAYKIKGDLILSNMHKISKGMKSVEVNNYYDENKSITIALDMLKSPSENSQAYFKKYNKLKTAQIKVYEQFEKTTLEIEYLEQVLVNIEQSPDQQNIEDIREELILSGYVKKKYAKNKKDKRKRSQSKPYMYKSSDGFEILVGKNNLQNDHLTLKTASNSDIWMHTKIIPGSHVIIRGYGAQIPEQTLFEAAMIAAFHSKAKNSTKVAVDYTEVRNVKKPNGAKPGMVIYATNSTIYATPDEDLINQLKIIST